MRKIRFSVAMSLDGYIAGPNGESDWIMIDPEIDFAALFSQFDTILLGRRTFEAMAREGRTEMPGMKTVVISSTLRQSDYSGVTVVGSEYKVFLSALRNESGKDIWLFGGGTLFRSLLESSLVDTVEVALIPVLLGEGIPLLPAPAKKTKLHLTSHRVYKSGVAMLSYATR
jgi:dihydrofolate reductase